VQVQVQVQVRAWVGDIRGPEPDPARTHTSNKVQMVFAFALRRRDLDLKFSSGLSLIDHFSGCPSHIAIDLHLHLLAQGLDLNLRSGREQRRKISKIRRESDTGEGGPVEWHGRVGDRVESDAGIGVWFNANKVGAPLRGCVARPRKRRG
jgi:hypothetical protein